MVKQFLDVFLEDFPNLPPDREIEFVIEVILEMNPISKAPIGWVEHNKKN